MHFSYADWERVLQQVVSDDGRVDYEQLRHDRASLDTFVAQLGAVSPQTDPALFPDEDARLAYWLNAYNAFTLHAIMDEYPISSVWKTREGRFFVAPRHVAGGAHLSLDDIEHEILRGEFVEPRIHFAINCGTNGCPPLGPAPFTGDSLRPRLRQAAAAFLAKPSNCRVEHAERRIYISRLFKMYAGDFAGPAATSDAYIAGVRAFVAEHAGLDLAAIAEYEMLYNTYDWGLNDVRREPAIGPITFHESRERFTPADGKLRELHLYDGNFCNRSCSWCTVFGGTDGWYEPYPTEVLDQAARTVAADGNLKFYGGEPTLHAESIIAAMWHLRDRGFQGLFTIYSNGVRAAHLIAILESDPRSEAVLNYSIFHGRDAEPLPAAARQQLEDWAAAHPYRIFKGYKVLQQSGAGAGTAFDRDRTPGYHGLSGGCVRCFPVLTSRGEFRACPFAVENPARHLALGTVGDDPTHLLDRYQTFLTWVDDILDPAAAAEGTTSCDTCWQRIETLPDPGASRRDAPAQPNPSG